MGTKLTPEERLKISKEIMDYAKKNPKYMARVREYVWKAQKRHLTKYN